LFDWLHCCVSWSVALAARYGYKAADTEMAATWRIILRLGSP
jgi:hypothetical protein